MTGLSVPVCRATQSSVQFKLVSDWYPMLVLALLGPPRELVPSPATTYRLPDLQMGKELPSTDNDPFVNPSIPFHGCTAI
jgi:hypothetical protein